MRPLWWWEERGYGLCRLDMRGKQEEVWRVFLRPSPGVQVEGLVTVRSPEACWGCEGLKTSAWVALGKGNTGSQT